MLRLGEAYLRIGRLNDAFPLAERSLGAAARNAASGMGPAAPRRDRHAPRAPEVDQAEAHYQQALTLAEALGMRPLLAHCHLGLGTRICQWPSRTTGRAPNCPPPSSCTVPWK